MLGAAVAFAAVGAALWLTLPADTPLAARSGSVEVRQIQERSWTVEMKDLGASSADDSLANGVQAVAHR